VQKVSALPTATGPDSDLLSTEVLAKYFNAREREVYFRSLKCMDDGRNFYPQLVGALTKLLAFFDDAASLELLDSVIFRSRKKLENVSQGLRILDYLRKANPRGVELLGLNPPVTFESLHAAYKKAAKRYHPDLGGSNENMKLVNIAFTEFHEVIGQWKDAPATEGAGNTPFDSIIGCWDIETRCAADYLISLGVLLVRVHTDSWAVDSAYSTLELLRGHGLLARRTAAGNSHEIDSNGPAERTPRLEQETEFVLGFPHLLIRLTKRLHTAGLHKEAKLVREYASSWIARAMEADHFPEGWRSSSKVLWDALEEAEAILDGETELKVVIMHPCQAENLLRLRVIDERRYREAQARFQKRGAKNESIELDLGRFRERAGFIMLSYDVPFRCEPGTKPLVPVPADFWERIDHLSDEQRAEYFLAFGPSGTCDALKQYLYTRATSYLCSLIHTFSDEEAGKVERECQFLKRLFPERAHWFDVPLGVSKHIRQLDPANRREKLTLLQKLDTSQKPTIGVIVISLSGTGSGNAHIRIAPTQSYLSVVMAAPDRLRMALRSGATQTAEEVRKQWEDRSHDICLVRDLKGNSITARARDADWHHRDEPEKVVEAFKPHIEQLLEAGNRMAPQNTGMLEIGHWIDGMSAALAKLKKWEEAGYWLELFLNLDTHYENRFGRENEKMLKRLARCKAQLTRGQV
jgi:hypothetical protein